MNLMLFNPEEFIDSSLRIRGARARELIRIRKIAVGDKIRIGQLGGLWGWGTVRSVMDGEVEVRVELNIADQQTPITLLLGLPRPQILKKVLQISSMMGVSALVLIRSARSEKSFLQSPMLRETSIEEHLRLGLEQGIATLPPTVELFTNFSSFRSEWLGRATLGGAWKLIAEPKAELTMLGALRVQGVAASDRGVVAIGPEAGWQENEIEAFNALGFQPFQLGNKILRVDVAVPVVLGQIGLLAEIDPR